MTQLPDLSRLSHDEKDALILALWAQVQLLTARVAGLEAKLGAAEGAGQFQRAALERAQAEPGEEGQAQRSASGQRGSHGRRTGIGREPG